MCWFSSYQGVGFNSSHLLCGLLAYRTLQTQRHVTFGIMRKKTVASILGEAVSSAALWKGPHGKELEPPADSNQRA